MSEQNSQKATPEEAQKARELFERTEAKFRHAGYVVVLAFAAIVGLPLAVGLVQGVSQDRVWDPFTGEPVSLGEAEVDCKREAADLIFMAGKHEQLEGAWDRRYHRWVTRCQDDHLAAYDLMRLTRERLRGAERPATD